MGNLIPQVTTEDVYKAKSEAQGRIVKWLAALLIVQIVFMMMGAAVLYIVWDVSEQSKRTSTDSNAILTSTLTDRDETIAAQKDVINQAVFHITRLATTVRMLGGDPGTVTLTPTTTTRPR